MLNSLKLAIKLTLIFSLSIPNAFAKDEDKEVEFDKTYLGTATIFSNNCPFIGGKYSMTLRSKKGDSSFDYKITKLKPGKGEKKAPSVIIDRLIETEMKDGMNFFVDKLKFEDLEGALVSSKGVLSANEFQITNYWLSYSGPVENETTGATQECKFQISATILVKVDEEKEDAPSF